MSVLDGQAMRDDIVTRLLQGEEDPRKEAALEVNPYLSLIHISEQTRQEAI